MSIEQPVRHWVMQVRLRTGEVINVDTVDPAGITDDSLPKMKDYVAELFSSDAWLHVESGGELRWFRPDEVREIRIVPQVESYHPATPQPRTPGVSM